MSNHKNNFALCLAVIVLAIGLLALAAQMPSAVQAGSLPPRETPTPTSLPSDDDKHDKTKPLVGAYLELVAPGAPSGAWAVVQWRCDKEWRDVEGWRGPIASNSRWWVHPKDFKTGPFRWVVTTGPDGSQWAVSPQFNLPDQPNEIMRVEVSSNP